MTINGQLKTVIVTILIKVPHKIRVKTGSIPENICYSRTIKVSDVDTPRPEVRGFLG